ncbi:MAG: nuclease [Caulobacter sp.]|nr:nuclease [Caulobacter sp.]
MIRKRHFVLALAVLTAACQKTPDPPSSISLPPGLGDRVRVLSADALVIDGKHVRLANAYAPQGIPDARCWAEAAAAKQATLWVRGHMRDARDVTVQPTGGFDEFHRELAVVQVDGVDLGQLMFENGLASRRSTGRDNRFPWCEPISAKAPDAPIVGSLLDDSKR